MKYMIGLFAAFATTFAAAQIVTLSDGTVVEITVVDPSVATAEQAEVCSALTPSACEYGSTEYCTYTQDKLDREDAGFTFETQSFLRGCDTNADGRYDYCLDYVPFEEGYTFEDQWYIRMCGSDVEWNPIQDRVLPE